MIPALVLFLVYTPLLALALLGAHGLVPLLSDPAWKAATLHTLRLAILAAPLAVACGLAWAVLLGMLPRRVKTAFSLLFALPVLLPWLWLLPRLQSWASGAPPGAREAALLATHALPAASLACLLLSLGLARIDFALLTSVRAAGGNVWTAWRLVVLPDFFWALIAAFAGAFAVATGLCLADGALAEASHPTLGTLLGLAVKTADVQTAPAGLLLAVLTMAPVAYFMGLSRLRRAL